LQNTVGTFLFDRETQRVNEAGELLVKWIITQAPINRRAVFVLKGDTADATNARVQSVQAAVAKYGCVCPVLLTDCEPAGWSAAYNRHDHAAVQRHDSQPALPPRQGAGGGSGAAAAVAQRRRRRAITPGWYATTARLRPRRFTACSRTAPAATRNRTQARDSSLHPFALQSVTRGAFVDRQRAA